MELRDHRQVREVYTIRQVTDLTGVPENTIRSWERRFGVPQPARSGSNQRRYSQRDVDTIRSIQDSRDHGRTMEQALQDLSENDSSVIEPANASRAPVPPPEVKPSSPSSSPGQTIVRLVDALLDFAGDEATDIMAGAMWSTSVEAACIDILLPVRQSITRQRAAGATSAVQAHFSDEWILRKLLAALDQSNPESGRMRLIVAAMHDASALHEALCLAIVFSRAGYHVAWLGSGATVEGIGLAMERISPEAALLIIGRSELSVVALKAAAEHLEKKRDAGDWQGLIAVNTSVPAIAHEVVRLPIHATQAVSAFEDAVRTHESSLRLVRNP